MKHPGSVQIQCVPLRLLSGLGAAEDKQTQLLWLPLLLSTPGDLLLLGCTKIMSFFVRAGHHELGQVLEFLQPVA